tara:strand:+ start:3961 stop:4248 length:288 start_codon:yes stop_codon:yes gene_type:complete
METSGSSGVAPKRQRRKRVYLYLLDDDYNSMEYVIKSLIVVLPMCNSLRAEQLALITHNNKECLIHSSLNSTIYIMYAQLQKLGLKVDIRYNKTK